MGDKSQIEWCDATWNPMTGCTKVSQGCKHCYAERVSERWGRSFKYAFHPERLSQPGSWQRPRMIFVCSMSDLFQEEASDEEISLVFQAMASGPQHTYQVLTKRIERARRFEKKEFMIKAWPPNVWLGTSVENQDLARERIPDLIQTSAKLKFLSVEPMLGPVSIWPWRKELQWVICGGESGPKARPMDPNWAQVLRDECRMARIPFFFKQWGGKNPKAGGRLLDGKLWDQMPA